MSETFKNIQNTYGRRRFHEIPSYEDVDERRTNYNKTKEQRKNVSTQGLMHFISQDIIGRDSVFSGPYGLRTIVYCDYVASGRALNSIETYIREHILPHYGNTHTTTTVTSLQSSMFQQEARMIIRNAVRASEHDAVIFTGNGVTGAVHKLITAMNFQEPPVVFVGPYEHHSNLLPWREITAHVICISENDYGKLNMTHLEMALKEWRATGLKMIGCFSAASNITGVTTDTVAVSALLHKYNALAFWDYATAAPYLDIDMHPLSDNNASKDAVFISMHKFVGGVDSPGVLVAKRSLFHNHVPSGGGGGSVFFVSRDSHRYLQDEETREEGGTPRLVGIVRASMAMELKQSVGVDAIMRREEHLYTDAMKVWLECPNLHLLGETGENYVKEDRLAIFSFMIYNPEFKRYLHHNFVSAILNDLFGIQARGGCACAGPYAQDLLGIDSKTAAQFEQALLEDSRLDRVHLRRKAEYSSHEVLRPGFVRLNIPYFASDSEAEFIIRAVAMVAEQGWKLLPQYMFNPETGEWRHTKHKIFADRRWLGHARFTDKGLEITRDVSHNGNIPVNFEDILSKAEEIFKNSIKGYEVALADHRLMFGDDVQDLMWFVLPSEAQNCLLGKDISNNLRDCAISVRKIINEPTHDELEKLVKIDEHALNLIKELQQKNTNKEVFHLEDNGDISNGNDDIVSTLIGSNNDESDSKLCAIPRPKNKINNLKSSSFSKRRVTDVDTGTSDRPIKFVSPPKRLFKLTSEAIQEFNMISDKDRVLVCLSGGKDSLSLLHVLHQYQFYAKSNGVNFELGAVTVDPMTSSFDPSPLIPYLHSLNVPYFYEEQGILDLAMQVSASSICSFCSRMKRGRIYACARREGWNVLAFGQHLDDLAESFLMSTFHNGLLRTMKANYHVKEGDLRVIRPFIYVRETDTRQFAESAKFPVIPENCPACFEAPKERHRMKQLLAAQEILHPKLFHSLKEAMMPLLSKNKTGMESCHKLRNENDLDIEDEL